jgi:2-isopropylmalate synthase
LDRTEAVGGELTSEQVWGIFQEEYLSVRTAGAAERQGHFEVLSHHATIKPDGTVSVAARLRAGDAVSVLEGAGADHLDAFMSALRHLEPSLTLLDRYEHAWVGGRAPVVAYVACSNGSGSRWGVGAAADSERAAMKAVVSACNREAHYQRRNG